MKKLTCIVCPKGCDLEIDMKNDEYIVTGNMCNRGKLYAINEMTNPMRSITTTIKTKFKTAPRLPVRTDKEIEVKTIFPIMQALDKVELDHLVHTGEVVVENVLDTGVNIIATSDLYELLEVR
jgi:CxxC motif-containing protein